MRRARRVHEGLLPLSGQLVREHDPYRTEQLVSSAHCHGGASERDAVPELVRADEDGPVGGIEPSVDTQLVQPANVALGHLTSQHRLDPRLVRFVLASREGEQPGVAIFDGDRCVQQRADGVGEGEEIAGWHPVDAFRLGGPNVLVAEQLAQQRCQLVPAGTRCQAEEQNSGLGRHRQDRRVGDHRGSNDETDGVLPGDVLHQGSDVIAALHAHTEHERAARQDLLVEGVVDDDCAHTVVGVRAFRLTGDEVQQRGAEVVDDPAEPGL